MKTGDAFSVPLSERAVAILADARRVARKEPTADSFVFFGVIPKRPLSQHGLGHAHAPHERGRDRARLPDQLQDVGERDWPRRVRGRRGVPVAQGRQRGEPSLCPFGHAGKASAGDGRLGEFVDGETDAKVVSIGSRQKRP